ncbi:MAG: lactate utilization protein [Desulfofustis sp.]|nr:lactate utilization protein [Desulfofustis sp.]RZW26509.1 MAG: lactate utilization protein [Desulfobulbaceae bacterium]MBT8345501.1 lactate utilization protein [Desulfofustis sp.]NNF45512.1 lactate utilization protein [Desulfofustis sp.]NNK12920.1 lactate utilization protein [Desulfofustis sp.]
MTDTKEQVATSKSDYEKFMERAEIAAAKVSTIQAFEEAVKYAIDLCLERPLNRYAISDEQVTTEGERKVIAAPALSPSEYELLKEESAAHSIDCLDSGMRNHLNGVDVGLSYGDLGLAETGTLVLNCPNEELRLATMVCEYHVCVLPKSKIYNDGYEAEEQLRKFMLDAPNYTAFITGPSRTADIERVLSIGVHGPLELHILILED